jgi:hypothetical protein
MSDKRLFRRHCSECHRMKAKLLASLERLEARTALSKPLTFRYGWLKPLPPDY